MKLLYTLAFSLISLLAAAQISINENDMPTAGEIYLISTASPLSIQTSALNNTGANKTWNFNLTSSSQKLDTSLAISQTPTVYQFLFFGNDYAQRQFQDINLGAQFSLSNIYNFYKKSSSKLELSGFGAQLNGIPIPVNYMPRDVVYKFPLNYGNADSSNSSFSLPVPGIGSWSSQRKRVNYVDGWGKLTTVLGTNDVLRVHSIITDRDSIYVDQLGQGVVIPRKSHEYKWLAKGGQIPLLQVNTTEVFGFQTVSQITYKDKATAVDPLNPLAQAITMYPVPVSDMLSISVENSMLSEIQVEVYTVNGQLILAKQFTNNTLIQVPVKEMTEGVYHIVIRQGEYAYARSIQVTH
jgi:hypothetical protein